MGVNILDWFGLVLPSKQQLKSTTYLWFIGRIYAKEPIATVINGLCVLWG